MRGSGNGVVIAGGRGEGYWGKFVNYSCFTYTYRYIFMFGKLSMFIVV